MEKLSAKTMRSKHIKPADPLPSTRLVTTPSEDTVAPAAAPAAPWQDKALPLPPFPSLQDYLVSKPLPLPPLQQPLALPPTPRLLPDPTSSPPMPTDRDGDESSLPAENEREPSELPNLQWLMPGKGASSNMGAATASFLQISQDQTVMLPDGTIVSAGAVSQGRATPVFPKSNSLPMRGTMGQDEMEEDQEDKEEEVWT